MKIGFLYIILLSFIILGCSNNDLIEEKVLSDKEVLIDEHILKANNEDINKEERINYAEAAFNLLLHETNNIEKRKKLTKLSRIYKNLDYDEKFKRTIYSSIELAKNISDSSGLAFNYNRLALYFDKKNKLDSTYLIYSKAEKIYSMIKIKRPFHHGRALLGIALVQRKVNNYTESISATVKAIRQFEQHDKADLSLSIAYSNLGIVSNNMEDYDNAIKYHKKSIEYAEVLKNKEERKVLAHNNIGVIYKNQKKYGEAIESFLKGLKYEEYFKRNPRYKALLLDNLTYSKFLSGKRKGIESSFFKSLKIRDSIDDKYGISINNLHLAEYYISIGDDSLAKVHAEKTIKVSKSIDINADLLETYKILYSLSDNKEGLYYAQAYIKLNDSLIKEERLFRDKLARIQFETEEKEQQIVEKEQQIVEVENQNTIYLLGMLLLLSGIAFAIYFFRQRTKYLAQQNQIVQFQASYETETRISKRLHDELGNDIFQVMLQYQNDPHDPQIKDKLNTTYHKARDISRENNEFDTDETFIEELSNMLQNYSKNGIQLMVRGLDKIDWDLKEKPVKITVYRVLQELMTNMQKHSNASLVVLVFSNVDQMMMIKYSDNGVGISKEDLKSKNGLRNTEKRIGAIGGTLIFESEKEKGFKAEIKIPN